MSEEITPIGQALKNRRIQKNLTLEEASDALRIQVKFLKALEDEHWIELPARVYLEGFLNKYAEFLGLDGTELTDRLRKLSGEVDKPGFTHPKPVPEAVDDEPFFQIRMPLVLLGVVFLVLIAAYFVRRQGRPATAPSLALHQVDDTEVPLPSSSPVAIATAPAVTTHEGVVQAKDMVWLRIWLDGSVRFEGTLVNAETRKWNFQKQIRLRAGNISRVALTIDGTPLTLPSTPGPMEILWPAPDDIQDTANPAARFVARPVVSRPPKLPPVVPSTTTVPVP